MPISREYLRRNQSAFFVVQPYRTVGEVLLMGDYTIRSRQHGAVPPTYETLFVVVLAANDADLRVVLLSELAQRYGQHHLNTPLRQLELPQVGLTVDITAQNIFEANLDRWLQQHPEQCLIVLDDEAIVAVLTNPTLGPIAGITDLLNRARALLGQPTDQSQPVVFRAYAPPGVTPGQHFPIKAYAFLPDLAHLVDADARSQQAQSGVPLQGQSGMVGAQLKVGAPLAVRLEADFLEAVPPPMVVRWSGSWLRFDLEVQVSHAPRAAKSEHTLSVIFSVGEVELCRVPLQIFVQPEGNMLHEIQPSQDTYMARRIFISYSRRDSAIVRIHYEALRNMGDDVFMDTAVMRAGEDWQERLKQAINECDTFMLFWSRNSAESRNVRAEWEYALKFRWPSDEGRGSIRPLYWEIPLDDVPPELNHLNFRPISLSPFDAD